MEGRGSRRVEGKWVGARRGNEGGRGGRGREEEGEKVDKVGVKEGRYPLPVHVPEDFLRILDVVCSAIQPWLAGNTTDLP